MSTSRNETFTAVSPGRRPATCTRRLPLPPRQRPGRTCRDEVRQAILQAAIDLVDNPRIGYRGLTMEAVARRAQVSKATLYRWWPGKPSLVLDAYRSKAIRDIPVPDTGDLATDLAQFLGHLAYAFSFLGSARTMAELIAVANTDPAFGEAFRATLLRERKQALRAIFNRARSRGEIAAHIDLDAAVDLAYGAVHHRLLVSHAPIDALYVRAILDMLLTGLQTRQQ